MPSLNFLFQQFSIFVSASEVVFSLIVATNVFLK